MAVVIGFIVWWGQREHTRILRSMDLRLAKALEILRLDTRQTPSRGVPIGRARSRNESDDPPVAVARTVSQDDIAHGDDRDDRDGSGRRR